jgi:hypothetical protein
VRGDNYARAKWSQTRTGTAISWNKKYAPSPSRPPLKVEELERWGIGATQAEVGVDCVGRGRSPFDKYRWARPTLPQGWDMASGLIAEV